MATSETLGPTTRRKHWTKLLATAPPRTAGANHDHEHAFTTTCGKPGHLGWAKARESWMTTAHAALDVTVYPEVIPTEPDEEQEATKLVAMLVEVGTRVQRQDV